MAKMNEKCTCSWPHLIIAVIVMSVGIFVFVNGFATQFTGVAAGYDSMQLWQVIVWYVVGLFIIFIGKIFKWMSHSDCQVHKGVM